LSILCGFRAIQAQFPIPPPTFVKVYETSSTQLVGDAEVGDKVGDEVGDAEVGNKVGDTEPSDKVGDNEPSDKVGDAEVGFSVVILEGNKLGIELGE